MNLGNWSLSATLIDRNPSDIIWWSRFILRNVLGDFHLCQTSVICKYLGEQFGLMPKSEEEKWQADQVNATIHDFVAEGMSRAHRN